MLTNFTYKKSQTNPYGVLVSITMSKEFTIDVLKKRDREVDESDVRLDKFLPDEILNAVANQDNEDLKNILKIINLILFQVFKELLIFILMIVHFQNQKMKLLQH